MSFDLREQQWIPVRRYSGTVDWCAPQTILDSEDPVVAVASGRPDFDGAVQEFLIGLLTAALTPEDDDEWLARWHAPPTPGELESALNLLPSAFELDGDGPRFFQDYSAGDFAETDVLPIERLLIDSPGEQSVRLNTDLFVKRGRVERLGRPAAALALLTLQTYAPSGGQGHRTSLRGGGPLTTLIDPRVDARGRQLAPDQRLWFKLWANVETSEQLANRALGNLDAPPDHTYPWLAKTRVSNPRAHGGASTLAHAHPLQAYFGLPRRIRLEFGDAARCDLTGRMDERTVVGFRMINYGVQYSNWEHPLSPYYRTKAVDEWLPVHGQPSGLGWRDWAALVLDAPAVDGLRKPARCVAAFHRRGRLMGMTQSRVHAFGYDMDNMKARGWIEASLPIHAVEDPERRKLLYDTASSMVEATSLAASALLVAVRNTLFEEGEDVRGDIGYVRSELWAATEATFYASIGEVATKHLDVFAANDLALQIKRRFVSPLEESTLAIFDRWCPFESLGPDVVRRRVAARFNLNSALRGLSKLGEKIFDALGVPHPGGGRAARATKRLGRKKRTSSEEKT
jgi:CRISPR system Cascade subunit CasA